MGFISAIERNENMSFYRKMDITGDVKQIRSQT